MGVSVSDLPGSVLHVQTYDENGEEVDRGHAIFLTSASSMNRPDITYCSNSPMKRNEILSSSFYSNPVSIIIPDYFQVPTSCTTHTYAPMQSVPGGYSTKCSVCNRSNLRITDTMYSPITVGTQLTLTATANYSCYRMAINIKHTDGTNLWYQFTNTDTATFAYRFKVPGLYTITFAARDANPDIESTSNGTSHTFTIRVYDE